MRNGSARWIAVVLVAFGLALAACGDTSSDKSPATSASADARSFAMGFSSLPSELTDESYTSAFELAASAGEVVLIRRAPPWQELLEKGASPSDKTAATTKREADLARDHELDLFFAIDATSTSDETGQLTGLPPDLPGVSFAEENVRQALITYARYVVVNYRPAYLAVGVDVNRYWQRDAQDFQQFVTLYSEIYDLIKKETPDTLVFPTFQLEELRGLVPLDEPHQPQWQLVDEFAGKMDLFAVSTYPGVVFSSAGEIPSDYYSTLRTRADVPLAIAETGYASQTSTSAAGGGSEAEQSAFLRRVLRDADRVEMPLLVWFAGQDPTFTGQRPTDLVQNIGLLRQDGTRKPAWSVWSEAARRPREPA